MMQVDKIASGAALIMQVSGGATIGIAAGNVLAQAASPAISIDPALGAAYGAIGALFGLVTWLAKGRIERCEKREDKMLDTEAEKTTTIRELSTIVGKAAEVAAMATEESKKNGQKLDALQSQVSTMSQSVAETSRVVTRFTDEESRRR